MATPKTLVLCFDGTWNKPADEHLDQRKRVQTNVRRFFEAVALPSDDEVDWDDHGTSCKFYDAGVGSYGCKYRQWLEGATGLGLDKNILDGYRFLARKYREGDRVYITGFSRGAYTARSLVGMIRNAGLLPDGQDDDLLRHAYHLYRDRDSSPDTQTARAFRQRTGARIIDIDFLGVWDTVGALGVPLSLATGINQCRYQFHDTELSSIVHNAFHAVAIDEHRRTFAPSLWTGGPKTTSAKEPQRVEQVWFAGCHSDVGGGYNERGLSDTALLWMVDRARETVTKTGDHRLGFDQARLPLEGCPTDTLHDELHGFYRVLNHFHRYRRTVCDPQNSVVGERLHDSVDHRIRNGAGYAPANPGFRKAYQAWCNHTRPAVVAHPCPAAGGRCAGEPGKCAITIKD